MGTHGNYKLMYKTSKLVLAALGLVAANDLTNLDLPVDPTRY